MLSHIFPVEVGMILCPAHRCQCERLYEGGQCIITTTTTKNEQKKSVLFPCTNYTICRNNAIQKKKGGGGGKRIYFHYCYLFTNRNTKWHKVLTLYIVPVPSLFFFSLSEKIMLSWQKEKKVKKEGSFYTCKIIQAIHHSLWK